jgi:hypothetical protein
MRCVVLFFAVLISTFAFSQATVISGYASDYVGTPGAYAAPFVPRVVTPEVAFATPPLEVGASNATAGNMAGATMVPPTQGLMLGGSNSMWETQAETPRAQTSSAPARGFNTGASIPQDAYGVAQLASETGPNRPAVRKFTNSDIEQMHNATR